MTLIEILEKRNELKALVERTGNNLSVNRLKEIGDEITVLDNAEMEVRKREEFKKEVFERRLDLDVVERKGEKKMEKRISVDGLNKRGSQYKLRSGASVSIEERAAGDVSNTSGNGIIVPKLNSKDITAFPWNEVSSILDIVGVTNLPNGSEYTKPFQISTGEGNYTLEPTATGTSSDDGKYTEVSTGFDKVTIKRNKVTALTYLSEELQDLPEANYAQLIEGNVELSLRKKIAKELILGDGTGSHFVGIVCDNDANINANTYKNENIDAVDENTQSEVVVGYGGDEDIESRTAWLMNKLTIKEFMKVRGADKRPVYNITLSGNTATIDGVRVVFTSNLKPLSEADAGDYWAVYGDFTKYELLNFGGADIQTSQEFKFDQGITAVRGRIYGGGAPAGYKAFTRIRKTPGE